MKILSNKAYRELIAEKELTELSLKSLKSKYEFISLKKTKTASEKMICCTLKSNHFPKKPKSTTFIYKNQKREKRRRGRRKNCEKIY